MTPPKESKPAEDKKARGPVNYMVFVENDDGSWWLAAADRESSSAQKLRGDLLTELEAAGHSPDYTRLVIIQTSLAQVVEHKKEVIEKHTFTRTKLTGDDASIEPPATLPPAGTEAGIAARAAASPAPAGALVDPAEAAAHAAVVAEAAERAASVPPVDPDDDEERGNPDLDPTTGLTRRTAAQARPEDEGRTVFPIEE